MPEALPVAAIRWGSIPPLLLISLAVKGSPGPATISLVAVGSVFGVRHSLKYLIGIIVGTTVVLVGVATGITAALVATPRDRLSAARDLGGVRPLAGLPHRERATTLGADRGRGCSVVRRRSTPRCRPKRGPSSVSSQPSRIAIFVESSDSTGQGGANCTRIGSHERHPAAPYDFRAAVRPLGG
jgi:hypothetical protein